MKRTLNEEVQRINTMAGKPLVKEYDINFDSEFTTRKVDLDVYGVGAYLKIEEGYDVDTTVSDATVVWSLNPDMRNWGIKTMGITVDRVFFSLEWAVYSYNEETGGDDRLKEGVIEFDSKAEPFNQWGIESEMKFEEDGQIYPSNVSVDFSRQAIVVSS